MSDFPLAIAGQASYTASMGKLASVYREERVARLWLEGRSEAEIGRELGIAVNRVKEHLKFLRKRWVASADANYAARMATEIARIGEVARKANAEWHRSRRNARVAKRTYEAAALPPVDPDAEPDPFADPPQREMVLVSETFEERGRCGDPSYLRIAKECAVEVLKLMGAYEPEQRIAFSPDQVFGLLDAAMRAVAQEGIDGEQLQRIKDRTMRLLPEVHAGGLSETPSPVVVADDEPSENDVSAQPEPPDRPHIDPAGYDEEAGGWQGEEI